MKTNIAIESNLVKEVTKLYRTRAKNVAVEKALRDQVRIKQQLKALRELQEIDWNENYNYKSARSK